MLQTGDILVGRYEVDSLLGRGGMSSVFSGWDRTLGREVAIKVLASELVEDGVFVERFDREARAAASLSHRNVVAVFDSGVDGGTRFIVMELVPGRTLAALLREGPLPVDRALDIAIGIAHALGAAHAHGIVHRDVKPGNVMIGENGHVKVLDFGIARALADTSLTQASTVIGTAGYLSPEQADGRAVDARSDLYGLGCVLYEMLTGRPPFVADSAAALMHQHIARPPEPPSRFRRQVSTTLDAIALKCLAKDPRERYPRAQALSAALTEERAAGDAVTDGRPAGPLALGDRRRRGWIAALAVAALALALLILALGHGPGHSGATAAKGAAVAAPASRPARSSTAATRTAASGGADAARPAPATANTAAGAPGSDPLSALILSDVQHGLIDQHAVEELSHRTVALLAAVASGDPGSAAAQLAKLAKRVESLAAAGHIATAGTAEALKAAAAALAGGLLPANSAGGDHGRSTGDGGSGTAPTGPAKGRDHNDGAGGGSQD